MQSFPQFTRRSTRPCTGGGKLTGRPVKVQVKVFGAPSLALESRELTLEFGEDTTTGDLLNSISVKDKDYVYIVREGLRLNPSSELNDGDEILVVPPIAGDEGND
jgi:molybdopterin converting factor small subunit